MKIRKRDSTLVDLDISQIRKQTIPACKGLKNIYPEDIELNAKIMFKDGMATSDIQDSLIKSTLGLVDVDKPDAVYAGGRLFLYDLYHKIKRVYYNKKVDGDVYKAIRFKDYLDFSKPLKSLTKV